jgi:hypothetical protein
MCDSRGRNGEESTNIDREPIIGLCDQAPTTAPFIGKLGNLSCEPPTNWTKGCVTHCGLAIYIKKHLKAKEELWKLKYFTMQKYNLQKYPLDNETKILQDIITL